MADYQLTATDNGVIRTADDAWIPNDPLNRDWIEYQDWLAAGGVPDPYVAPITPAGVTPPTLVGFGHADIKSGAITLAPDAFNIARATYVSRGTFRFDFIEPLPDASYSALISCGAAAELAEQRRDQFTILVGVGANLNPHDPKSVDFQIFKVLIGGPPHAAPARPSQ